jgi:hypothetical protein
LLGKLSERHHTYWWFCRLDLEDKVPDHSTLSVNRHGRFREHGVRSLSVARHLCHR